MGWPFGLPIKKIAQVPPSQTGTGTPGDLSWIDDARLKRAKDKAKKGARAKAQAAIQAKIAATAAEKLEAERTKALNRYASDIKTVLPRGVEIVEAFFSDRPEASHLTPAVRVDLGNGVQCDLELGYIIEPYPGNSCIPPFGRAYTILTANAVGGAILKTIRTNCNDRPSPKHFSKREVGDLLLSALENQDFGHSQSLSQ